MMTKIKRYMTLLLLCVGFATGYAQSEGLMVSKMTFDKKSNQWVVTLNLKSADKKFVAYQCDLAFPSSARYQSFQVQYAKKQGQVASTDWQPSHQIIDNVQENGLLRLVSSSKGNGIISDDQTLKLLFSDNGELNRRKSYDVNLTNIELVYQGSGRKLRTLRQQGLINDVSLPCFDALCNESTVCGPLSAEDEKWLKTCLSHNDQLTFVDVSRCPNVSLDPIAVGNPNALVMVHHDGQVVNNNNLITSGECKLLVLSDAHPYQTKHDFTAKDMVGYLHMDGSGYIAAVLPFSCDIPQGLEAYRLATLNDAGDCVVGERRMGIEAHRPFLLKGAPGVYAFKGATQLVRHVPQEMRDGLLTGSYLPVFASPGCYLLVPQGEGMAFSRLSHPAEVKPFRASLQTGQTDVPLLQMNLVDGVTGMGRLTGDAERVEGIYNLGGQRLKRTARGVNLLMGKDGTTRKVLAR